MTRLIISRRTLLCGVAALPLVACSPVPDLMIVPEAAITGVQETVFVATNRVFADGDFQDERQDDLSYTRFAIAVPPDREAGAVEPGRAGRWGPNLRRQFVASVGDHLGTTATFRSELRAEADRTGTREVMIFIHGFNNTLGDGLYRTAQIHHDFAVPGVAVHYAWPSAGSPFAYAYDRDSALFARDGLEALLTEILAADLDIVLVAHSLGAGLVMEVLRQLRIGGRDAVIDRIKGVFLFSPDIDVDVFRGQAARIGTLPQPFVMFTSQRDRALTISAGLAGARERVGNMSDAGGVSDFEVTLIDTSAYGGGLHDPLNHFAGATSPAVVQILREITQMNEAFEHEPTDETGDMPGTIVTIENATLILLRQ